MGWLAKISALPLLLVSVLIFSSIRHGATAGEVTCPRDDGSERPVITSPVNLPMAFEENSGQAAPGTRYLAKGRGYSILFSSEGPEFAFLGGQPGVNVCPDGNRTAVRMRFLDGADNPVISAEGPLPGLCHYFIGDDPARWIRNVRTFERVRYRGIYPGTDVIFYGREGHIEFDIEVAPGADPSKVRIALDPHSNSSPFSTSPSLVDAEGNLHIPLAGSDLLFKRPVIYQEDGGKREEVAGTFTLRAEPSPMGEVVGFALGRYDRSRPLVIDPQLVYSTYFGGQSDDDAFAVVVDSSGSTYFAGRTMSTPNGSLRAFCTKLNPAGSAWVYSAVFGGDWTQEAHGLAVDSSGCAIVSGWTDASNFPTKNPLQPHFGGSTYDAFACKLNAAGNDFVWSTYLGGDNDEQALAAAVDASGNAYIAGYSGSTNFPVKNAFQPAVNAPPLPDAFLSKIKPDGSAFVYSTLAGKGAWDQANSVAVDAAGSAYIVGTCSPGCPGNDGFPIKNPLDPGDCQRQVESFVTKFTPSGSDLVFSTYFFGGVANAVTLDSQNNIYVGGGWPNRQAYVDKVNAAGTSRIYNWVFGGNGGDWVNAVVVDAAGNAYATGETEFSPYDDFPVLNAFQSTPGGNGDAFVVAVKPDGSGFIYSSYLGGDQRDEGYGIALGPDGTVTVGGQTESGNFPTKNPFQGVNKGGTDAFVTRVSSVVTACTITCTATAPASGQAGSPLNFSATAAPSNCTGNVSYLWEFGDGGTSSSQNPSHAYASAGTYNWSMTASVQGVNCSKSGNIAISGAPTCTLSCTATAPASGKAGTPISFSATATPLNCTGSVSYAWAFGDGGTSGSQNPIHIYTGAGSFDWTMTAIVEGVTCSRTGSIVIAAGGGLPGDCDGNGTVSIGEVQKAINMFLGLQAPGCGVDCNGDGNVSIGEVQKAINAFLGLASSCG